jgi:hypothetical protein
MRSGATCFRPLLFGRGSHEQRLRRGDTFGADTISERAACTIESAIDFSLTATASSRSTPTYLNDDLAPWSVTQDLILVPKVQSPTTPLDVDTTILVYRRASQQLNQCLLDASFSSTHRQPQRCLWGGG